jgi:hypothetical protein
LDVYIGLMLWSILAGSIFFVQKDNTLKKKIYILLVYIPLIIISGLRDISVGTDTAFFHEWYVLCSDFNDTFGWYIEVRDNLKLEFVFVYVAYFFNQLSFDVQVMIFIMSTLTLLGVAYAFYKYSESIWLSTFLFIAFFSYQETMNIAKQGLAAMIIFNAYGYLKNNLKWKYLRMIVISMCAHTSAIMHLIIFLLIPVNLKKILFTIISVGVIIFFGGDFILSYLMGFSLKYIELYIGTSFTMSRGFGPGLIQIFGIVVLMSIIYYLNKCNRFTETEKKDINVYSVYMLLYIIVIFLQYIIPIVSRLDCYVAWYIYLLIPILINKLSENKSLLFRYILYIVIIIIGFLYCICCMNIGIHEVVPYKFCF